MEDEDKKFKSLIIIFVFFILLVIQNLTYADFFLPYYILIPESIQMQVPGVLMIFLFFINLCSNLIILTILLKILYDYEKIVPIIIGANITTFFQVLLTFFVVNFSFSLFGNMENTTVLGCLLDGSGIFAISFPLLFVFNMIVIRYILKMREIQVFYAISMSILLNPIYHYLLFYTPIVRLLNLTSYVF